MTESGTGPGTGPILAIDASSARPTVALIGPDGEPWGLWTQEAGRRGTAILAVRAGELLEARSLAVADLGGVAVERIIAPRIGRTVMEASWGEHFKRMLYTHIDVFE